MIHRINWKSCDVWHKTVSKNCRKFIVWLNYSYDVCFDLDERIRK